MLPEPQSHRRRRRVAQASWPGPLALISNCGAGTRACRVETRLDTSKPSVGKSADAAGMSACATKCLLAVQRVSHFLRQFHRRKRLVQEGRSLLHTLL